VREKLVALLLVAASSGCVTTAPATHAPSSAAPQVGVAHSMRVHFIDVGQGAATLFEFPGGAVLVDVGGERNQQFDGCDRLGAYLDAVFARRVDIPRELAGLVLTHPHIDHTRCVDGVLEKFPPRNVITNGQTSGSGGAQQVRLHEYAAAAQTGPHGVGFRSVDVDGLPALGLHDLVPGSLPGNSVAPVLTALWGRLGADPGWGTAFGKQRFDNANNHSLVLRVDFGEASVLITGDLEDVGIGSLLTRYAATSLLDTDVYQVGHHGSLNGTTAPLLEAVTPDYAVIGVGSPSRELSWTAWAYGHPRREVLALLEQATACSRSPITVLAGVKGRTFEPRTIAKAIYATGWDGTVVLEAHADGTFRVVPPDTAPIARADSGQITTDLQTLASPSSATNPPSAPVAPAAATLPPRQEGSLSHDR
jgi:competence protein ComEC